MKLPIELIPGTNPPKFRWYQTMPSTGVRVKHESTVQPNLEHALLSLILLCEEKTQEIISLRKQVEGHAERIAAQSELLSKQAEKPTRKEKDKGEK